MKKKLENENIILNMIFIKVKKEFHFFSDMENYDKEEMKPRAMSSFLKETHIFVKGYTHPLVIMKYKHIDPYCTHTNKSKASFIIRERRALKLSQHS